MSVAFTMTKVSFLAAFMVSLVSLAGAYDIGCIYPETMPDPLSAILYYSGLLSMFLTVNAYETPVVVHLASLYNGSFGMCLAYHDTHALHLITKERPRL